MNSCLHHFHRWHWSSPVEHTDSYVVFFGVMTMVAATSTPGYQPGGAAAPRGADDEALGGAPAVREGVGVGVPGSVGYYAGQRLGHGHR